MPYVNIRLTGDPITPDQKDELIKKTTEMLQTVLNKDPEKTFVVIEELPMENWGVGGRSVAARRAEAK